FTYAGLQALGVDHNTLETFPQPFREGMAYRAALLGDTGANAPERWDGYLGSQEIHGVAWGSLQVRTLEAARDVAAWYANLVEAARATFPLAVRRLMRALSNDEAANRDDPQFSTTEMPGAEVLHFEIGMANYENGQRMEHFGFRDGISEPYADIG